MPAISGLDTDDGLTRVGGNQKLYLKLLRQFAEQQGSATEDIRAALDSDNPALAERLAHTIKGVSAILGAKTVQGSAGNLEKRIRARAERSAWEPALEQLSATLELLLTEIRVACFSPTPRGRLLRNQRLRLLARIL